MSALDGVTPAVVGAANATGGNEIERSLRFNSADSAYLSKTFSSAGNRKTWTLSFWVKLCGSSGHLISAGNDAFQMEIRSDGQYLIANSGCFSNTYSTAVFRDYSAWQHFVIEHDATNTYCKIYINGSLRQTITASNADGAFNNNTAHNFSGRSTSLDSFTDFYLAEVHFVDGTALAASDFGEYDDNNVWQPKAYSGSYGTNGFNLKFDDNSSAAALGTDSSGNSNTWTVNNISVSSGTGNDSLIDTPTNYEAGSGNNGGNYATINPLSTSSTLANGNLQLTTNSGIHFSTIGVSSGKWYAEWTATSAGGTQMVGIAKGEAGGSYLGQDTNGFGYYGSNGQKYNGGGSSYGATYGSGDVIGVALNLDDGNIVFYKNGASQGTAFTGLSGTYFFAGGESSMTGHWNFGQRPFVISSVPTGHSSFCTQNFADPTIADGSTAMDATLYTGNGSTQSITGLGFSPDLVWVKRRNSASDHQLYDIVRGANKGLSSNLNSGEWTYSGGLSSFDSNGFSVGSLGGLNGNGDTHVAWTWDGGTSTASNTDGSITSSVRANASAGFSIVGYTGDGNAATIGHGLNAAPELIIKKFRSATSSWDVYHASAGSGKRLVLNATDAVATTSSYANVNSSTFDVHAGNNDSGVTMIAYCFAPVAGYSAFGSYTGNGSSDGPFVYTGFRPKWILFKMSSSTGDWRLMDTSRDPYNPCITQLYPNNSDAENASSSAHDVDYLSNGFRVTTSHPAMNSSGQTYVYAAFAEHPLKTARAR